MILTKKVQYIYELFEQRTDFLSFKKLIVKGQIITF
jgi:hypothetical protein